MEIIPFFAGEGTSYSSQCRSARHGAKWTDIHASLAMVGSTPDDISLDANNKRSVIFIYLFFQK